MNLTLAERFLILTHKTDKTGFNVSGVQFTIGLTSTMFLDLVQNEEVNIVENKLICAKQAASQSIHPLLFTELSKSKRTRKLKDWFQRLNHKTLKFKKALLEKLAKEQIIEIEKKKFLGLIPYSVSHLSNKPLQAEMIREIKNAILMKAETSNENGILIGILATTKTTNFLGIDRQEKKEIRNKIKLMEQHSAINDQMSEAIKQMQAAVMVAVITPTVTH